MAMLEDLTPFFNTAEFADEAALTRAEGGLAITGVVIYDENGTTLGEFGIDSAEPGAVYPIEQWSGVKEGDMVEIFFRRLGRRGYRVRSAIPIGDGAIGLMRLARL